MGNGVVIGMMVIIIMIMVIEIMIFNLPALKSGEGNLKIRRKIKLAGFEFESCTEVSDNNLSDNKLDRNLKSSSSVNKVGKIKSKRNKIVE